MRRVNYSTDLCVVGGGMSGVCAAIAAARHGIKVVLVQDRPVLGGNASSEIRMHIGGAHGKDNRETGIIEEIILENFYLNPQESYTVWDSVIYGKVMAEENITLLLNSSVLDADCENGEIKSVTAWQSNAETFHKVSAKYFADCSGDSILSTLSGAEFRYGRESKSEFGESIPPDVADSKTMGMSCLMQLRETDRKTEFIPPEWAYKYESDEDLPFKDHDRYNNFWWIEVGGEWDCIHDTDRCRDECLKIAFGVWDHMKNHGDHGVENWVLDWIGFLPGKRESRRYVGECTVTENDVLSGGRYDDIVAYAGWTMDDHFPQGFYYRDGYPTIFHPAPSPWGLPLRCMISKNVKNLVFAGRNISVTHAALSSSRVMATCAVLGQALGTAVAQALETECDIRKIDVSKLQQTLMKDDCFIPYHRREVSGLSAKAAVSDDVVRNGAARGDENCWVGALGDSIRYDFSPCEYVSAVRIVFDSDLNREGENMTNVYTLDLGASRMPKTLVKEYKLVGETEDGEKFEQEFKNTHVRFACHRIEKKLKYLELVPLKTWGSVEAR
ncbi:MAG: FAD-dependent oxidoreductase, partial [Oscillospiraceae bacterium]|nr:FAD-dependent oxidoreductase [Oscillospiraceae bacterium]